MSISAITRISLALILMIAIFGFQNCAQDRSVFNRGDSLSESHTPNQTENTEPASADSREVEEPASEGKPSDESKVFRVQNQTEITSNNRSYHDPNGAAYGGWGQNLRSLLRNSDGDLFFVVDRGPSVLSNSYLDYYKRSDNGLWTLVASQAQIGGIQQNVASVISHGGRTILSYGISVTAPYYLQQCYFDTKAFSSRACNAVWINGKPLEIQSGGNYIGAAVDPESNSSIVWWNSGHGNWNYIYTVDGFNWFGPVENPLNGYGGFMYVSGALRQGTFTGAGELFSGTYTPGQYAYQGGIVQLKLGSQAQLSGLWNGDSTYRVLGSYSDVFVSPRTGAIHVISNIGKPDGVTNLGDYAYFYTEGPAVPKSGLYPKAIIRQRGYAKFHENNETFSLFLTLTDGSSRVEVFRTRGKLSDEPMDLDATASTLIPIDPTIGDPSAIYVESPKHQSGSEVKSTEIALCGNYSKIQDHRIIHISLDDHKLAPSAVDGD